MTYSLKPPLSFSAIVRRASARPVPWMLIGMIAATGVSGVLAVPGAIAAIMSPMVFDARGSALNPLAWLGFILVISFWAVCLIGPFVAWVFWARKDIQRAWAFMALPLAWGVLTLAVLQFLPGG